MKSNLEYEHVEMRKLLDKLRLYKDLTFRSEKVPVLLSDFLEQVCAHFKSERRELLTVLESQADKEAYDTHYLSVLEEISEIQFGLIRNQDMSVGSVLPRMEDWVATHEHLHSHLNLSAP